ncbi:MAG: hypothetical protein KF865_01635 [Bdellovibrionaceae bacterium]|nr:hypothetical protein [Pseudobdellovibrionaceae bacterium]
MMKTIEKALWIAEDDTCRRKSAPTLRQIESRLMKNLLAQSLALEILRNSQKPTADLISDLIEIEAQVGEFIGGALMQSTAKHKNKIDLRGVLAGALSLMPMPTSFRKQNKFSLKKIALTWVKNALEENQLKELPPLGLQEVSDARAASTGATLASPALKPRGKKTPQKALSKRAPKKNQKKNLRKPK